MKKCKIKKIRSSVLKKGGKIYGIDGNRIFGYNDNKLSLDMQPTAFNLCRLNDEKRKQLFFLEGNIWICG